jgi:hypothetical protein
MWWPKLEDEISAILSKPENSAMLSKHRPDRDILGEILQLSRITAENVVAPHVSRQAIEELLAALNAMVFLARMENPDGMTAALSKIERPLRYICRKADSLDLFDDFIGNIHPRRRDINRTRESLRTKRTINDFDVTWTGVTDTIIEVRRLKPPTHRYEFETSPNRRRIKRLYSTSPVDVLIGDPLSDAEQFEEYARAAAAEYL